jgi:hypothetical protein
MENQQSSSRLFVVVVVGHANQALEIAPIMLAYFRSTHNDRNPN